MNHAKAGIVIPAYNAGRYITQCVESALAQDYPFLHIYVVDDASTDNTCEALHDIARRSAGRITWNARSENRGAAFTRQEVTQQAISDGCSYIIPLDADDLRKPNTISRQIEALDSAKNAALCYGCTDFIHADGSPYLKPRWERYAAILKRLPQGEVWKHLITRGKIGTMDTVVIRSDAAASCCYEPAFRVFEDVDYLSQIATLPSRCHFVALRDVVATYRFHGRQSSDCIGRERFFALAYETMCRIAVRIFWRLDKQGRPLPVTMRRRLWRLLVLRSFLMACRNSAWRDTIRLAADFLTPIERLESSLRTGDRASFQEVLGVWDTTGDYVRAATE